MGKATVHIYDGNDPQPFAGIFHAGVGGPAAFAKIIKDVLGGREVVEELGDPSNQIQGMGDAAALLLSELKTGAGTVYLVPGDGTPPEDTDYVFQLRKGEDGKIHLTVVNTTTGQPIEVYEGSLNDLVEDSLEEQAA